MSRRLAVFCASVILAGGSIAGAWCVTASPAVTGEATAELPVPPFPPRMTDGHRYEACLTTLADDPMSAVVMAEAWQAEDGGDGAAHCLGLGLIAVGKPALGAELLEQLVRRSNAPAIARAMVLGQAAQARLMAEQADKATADASMALELSPKDPDLLIMRATSEGLVDRISNAVDDLTEALGVDAKRADALVLRAAMRRKLNDLELAQADVAAALTLDPDDPDALLERGILRQRMGDAAGARTDWEHARGVDPTSPTAELAVQNLSLLEAGPLQQ